MTEIIRNLSFKQTLSVILIGALLGWWLGKRRGIFWLIGFLIVVLSGWVWLFLSQSGVSQAFWGWARVAVPNLWQEFLSQVNIHPQFSIDSKVVDLAWQDFVNNASVYWFQLTGWLSGLLSGSSTYDQISAGIFWGSITWMCFVWSGLCLRKWNNVFLGLAPIGTLLAGLINRSEYSAINLLVFCGLALMLISVISYHKNKDFWIANHLDYAEDVGVDIAVHNGGIILLLLLGGLIFSQIPILNLEVIQDWTSRFKQEDHIISSEPLGLQAASVDTSVFGSITSVGLPRQHLIGASPELSKRLVMVVEIIDEPSQEPKGYYWRSNTYDTYIGRGWVSSPLIEKKHPAGVPLPQPDLQAEIQIEQRVSFPIFNELQARQVWNRFDVYVAGELVAIDQPMWAAWRPLPETAPGIDFFGAKTTEGNYRALSRLTVADATLLRQAGQDYPDWLRERYLQLPDNLSDRLINLAESFDSMIISPYDQVRQIEAYLRTFRYSLDLPAPPPDVEIVDYFIFDLKTGYCDYYASAMVVLSRLIGIPSRLATGYVSSTYDPVTQRYFTTEADAHSWPEIYFPGIGWVAFEPTGGRGLIEYVERTGIVQEEESLSTEPEWLKTITDWEIFTRYLPLLALLLTPIFLILLMNWYTKFNRKRTLPYNVVLRSYQTAYQFAKPLASDLPLIHTAHEFADSVGHAIGGQKISELVRLYEKTVFSHHLPGRGEAQRAVALRRQIIKICIIEQIKTRMRRWTT